MFEKFDPTLSYLPRDEVYGAAAVALVSCVLFGWGLYVVYRKENKQVEAARRKK